MSDKAVFCETKDQFCLGVASHQCRECGSETCAHCSEPTGSGADAERERTCHACLRKMGLSRLVELHLRQLGGQPEKADPPGWERVRK